jgi:hypothetical protein
MNSERTNWTTQALPDDTQDNTLRVIYRDFFNRKMTSIVAITLVYSLIFMVLAVFCAVQFFKVEQTREQILYAALFICLLQWLALMKLFALQFILKNSINRSIKRLEIHVAQLDQTLKNKNA